MAISVSPYMATKTRSPETFSRRSATSRVGNSRSDTNIRSSRFRRRKIPSTSMRRCVMTVARATLLQWSGS